MVNRNELYEEVLRKAKDHIGLFGDLDKPLFRISDTYNGVWLEHVYDAVIFAYMFPEYTDIAVNTINAFLDRQTEEGQLPAYLCPVGEHQMVCGRWHTQECVSFTKLAWMTYKLCGDRCFLEKSYRGCVAWDKWFETYRMKSGLVEMFVGYDTGHDNSSRLDGMKFKGHRYENGKNYDASEYPGEDDAAPVIAVDLTANRYCSEIYLARMAAELGLEADAYSWRSKASELKSRFIDVCYDRDDNFFYDVGKDGVKRKMKSCTVFHLYMESVLDPGGPMARCIYKDHIINPDEFWTEYPFPSMAVNDQGWRPNTPDNCWSYFSQALIALRCTMWMDRYGHGDDFDRLLEKWCEAIELNYGKINFCQELHPLTGEPSGCSQWYSSCMLLYLYAVRRLDKGIVPDLDV